VPKVVLPLPFVSITITPDVDAVTLGSIVEPLTYIRFILDALPDSIALLDAPSPFTVVDLSIIPRINTFTVGFALFVMALEKVSSCEKLIASTMPLVFTPFPLICTALFSVY
jgi:hypothetical protein